MTTFETDAATIGAMLDALQSQDCRPKAEAVARHVSKIVERGWAPKYRVYDLLQDLGASWFWIGFDAHALFSIPRRTIYNRPSIKSRAAFGFDETAAADLATLLIQIERLGLGIDPSPLVNALRPLLLKRQALTQSELNIIWFARERHRLEPVTIEAGERPDGLRPKKLKLATGYKVEAWRNAAGEVGSMTVKAPKYRRPRR